MLPTRTVPARSFCLLSASVSLWFNSSEPSWDDLFLLGFDGLGRKRCQGSTCRFPLGIRLLVNAPEGHVVEFGNAAARTGDTQSVGSTGNRLGEACVLRIQRRTP